MGEGPWEAESSRGSPGSVALIPPDLRIQNLDPGCSVAGRRKKEGEEVGSWGESKFILNEAVESWD